MTDENVEISWSPEQMVEVTLRQPDDFLNCVAHANHRGVACTSCETLGFCKHANACIRPSCSCNHHRLQDHVGRKCGEQLPPQGPLYPGLPVVCVQPYGNPSCAQGPY